MLRDREDPKSYTWTSRGPGLGMRHTPVTQGVWVIDHEPTGWFMIGRSRNVSAEVDKHLAQLAAGRHPSKRFQRQYSWEPDVQMLEYPASSANEAKKIEAILRSNNTGSLNLCN